MDQPVRRINIAQISLSEAEIDAAVAVLRSGSLRQGPECASFEAEFAKAVGARYAVSCSSGTAALHMAYLARFKPGDEVLVPSFTFVATASMLAVMGAKPIFVDVDPTLFTIDLADARTQLTDRTRGIAPVHLYGNPCDVDAIGAFCQEYDLDVVWDSAQAHGATYKGQGVGSEAGISCFSFYPSKNMMVGEGGMLCTNDEEVAAQLKLLREHGQTGRYHHEVIGLNYRMTDVEAAIGRHQLQRLPSMVQVRRTNAARLTERLQGIDGLQIPQPTPGADPCWHQYSVIVHPEAFGCDRDELASRLNNLGISTGVHYPKGLHQQPVFADIADRALPVTEQLAARVLCLPVHHGMTPDDADVVADAIIESK